MHANRGSRFDSLWLRLPGSVRHGVKRALQATVLRNAWRTKTVFVSGCQRSGSAMMLWTLDLSVLTRVFDEGDDNRAFHEHRIRPIDEIRALTGRLNVPVTVFRTMCDAHRVDRFLAEDPNAWVLWMYRNHRDVARSAVKMWGPKQLNNLRTLVTVGPSEVGWRGERVGDETLSQLRSAYDRSLTPLEGAALFWYLRNRLFFELGLVGHPRALPVRYEELVRRPVDGFHGVFERLGLPFSKGYADWIRTDKADRSTDVPLRSDIDELCAGLLRRLEGADPGGYGGPFD